ncbi:uncharacterized protein [Diadema setosum]|uniref:uncharacterized protein n=1 Tax=Diadema setosum TaxID=31175 RepID=UPI003B3A0D88
MARANLGQNRVFLPPFSSSYDDTEDWDCYVERFELYLLANGLAVPDEPVQSAPGHAMFLHSIEPKYYSLVRDLVAPATPQSKSYNELKMVLRRHLKSTPMVVAERRKFIRRDQAPDESTSDYVVQLKHLSLNCQYGDKLDEQLRDRFISGISHEPTSLKLMEKATENPRLSFREAVDYALQRETAAGEARAMRNQSSRNGIGDYSGARPGTRTSTTVNAVYGKSHGSTGSGNRGRKEQRECYRCGRNHAPDQCWFKSATCRCCQKKGHIERKCRSKPKPMKNQNKEHTDSRSKTKSKSKGNEGQKRKGGIHNVKESREYNDMSGNSETESERDCSDKESDVEYDHTMFKLRTESSSKSRTRSSSRSESGAILAPIEIEGKLTQMEVDTGSSVSIIPLSYYEKHLSHLKMDQTEKSFVSFTGETVEPVGKVQVQVRYGTYQGRLALYVLECTEYMLLGREWLGVIPLDWKSLVQTSLGTSTLDQKVNVHRLSDQVVQKHEKLFDGQLGKLSHAKASIRVKDDATPVRTKPYKVPYALKAGVEQELDRLEKCGVLTPIEHSEWSTGIVPVPKKDGTVRLCGNYKCTVNPVLSSVAPPNINVDDILSSLSGGVTFSKLDLAHAYNQTELDENSKQYLVLSTHKGLFKQNRLVFGITTAPAIWQNAIDKVLQGLPGVQVYLDDILVTGSSQEEHMRNLDAVLTRLEQRGLKLKKEKCEFECNSVEFLGHRIDAQGVHTVEEKVKQIVNLPRPTDVSQLRSYLGLLNYYRKYVPNLAHVIAPLTDLLKSDRKFAWSEEAETAFKRSKELLQASDCLIHYDPQLPISIATDASPIGIGAVLSHVLPDGTERPIQFASRSLTKTERKYPQIEREALAIIFALRKFYMYIYGRRFTLITDNKPLTALLGPYKSLPTLAAERMQRWAMYLAGFDYEIRYRTSKANANADCFSRLPDSNEKREGREPGNVSVCHVDMLPTTHEELRNATRKDPILSKVLRYTLDGWPKQLPTEESELKTFFMRRTEITIEQGILMWGMRIIIPHKMQKAVLAELHQGHLGVVKMKSIARSYVWWPHLDSQIEECTKRCETCQVVQNQPAQTLLHPWIPASKPMERIHVDFAGPFEGLTYMVIVDAYSKWPEVFIMPSITSERTIDTLRSVFARYGLPQIIVTDNGSQFTSAEFQEFVHMNGIKHKRSAPYHPSTNGQAERFVQTLRQSMRASRSDGGSAQAKLDRFLLAYRNAAHSVTGESPASLFMKRQLRMRLDNLRPNIERRYAEQLHYQASLRDKRSKAIKMREFAVGQSILARDYTGKRKWVPGVVVEREGPLMYKVQVQTGFWRRHVDQLLSRLETEEDSQDQSQLGNKEFDPTRDPDSSRPSRSVLRDTFVLPRHTGGRARDLILNLELRGDEEMTPALAFRELLDEYGDRDWTTSPMASFYARTQQASETPSEYAVALEAKLRVERDKGDQAVMVEKTVRDAMLTAQFMFGLMDQKVRARLAPMRPREITFRELRRELHVIAKSEERLASAQVYRQDVKGASRETQIIEQLTRVCRNWPLLSSSSGSVSQGHGGPAGEACRV